MRYDLLDVRPRAVRTQEGFLEALSTPIARTGVLEYRRNDGSIQRELRLPEDVFDAGSIRTLNGKPVTVEHPPYDMPVTADTASALSRGAVSNPRRDTTNEDLLLADVHVHAKQAIQAIEAGRHELSAGYSMIPVPLPGGVFKRDGHPLDGTRADVLQTSIRYNHVAITQAGRANNGTSDRPVRLRLDSAGNQVLDDHKNQGVHQVETIEIIFEGRTYVVRKDSADQFRANLKAISDDKAAAVARADASEAKASEAVTRADAVTAERDELKTKLEAAEAKATEAEKLRADAADPEKVAAERTAHVALVMDVQAAKPESKLEELVRMDSNALRIELATSLGIEEAAKEDPVVLGKLIDFAKKNRSDSADNTQQPRQNAAGSIATAIQGAPARRADAAVADSPYLIALKERDEMAKAAKARA